MYFIIRYDAIIKTIIKPKNNAIPPEEDKYSGIKSAIIPSRESIRTQMIVAIITKKSLLLLEFSVDETLWKKFPTGIILHRI